MRHEPQTRRRTKHIRRFRHISVVDPGYVVDRMHSRTLDQPQNPDHHANRRTPPPGVTPVAYCDGGDEQRQAESCPDIMPQEAALQSG